MKINYRIILINIVIVAVILGASGSAFYTIMYNVLTSQQSKHLLTSTNDFAFVVHGVSKDVEDAFSLFLNKYEQKPFSNEAISVYKNLDFVIKLNPDSTFAKESIAINKEIVLSKRNARVSTFITSNPLIFYNVNTTPKGETYLYGKNISQNFINELSSKIRAEVAIYYDNNIVVYSNETVNQNYFFNITEAYSNLNLKNNYDIFTQETETSYFLATVYKMKEATLTSQRIGAIIFTTLNETQNLKTNIKNILVILGIAGLSLSVVLTLLLTGSIRRQIHSLTEATEITKTGNFSNRMMVETKDELGELAIAFNKMLDELERKEKTQVEYSDFITMINENPSLKDISDSSLKKIINITECNVGAIYSVIGDEVTQVSSYGVNGKSHGTKEKSELFKPLLEKLETVEINFREASPIISSGLVEISLKYLLLLPIIFNKKTIGILELGSVNKPSPQAKEYLELIKDQLAIGLTNAIAFVQMENLVEELKQLNENYQKQNEQIKSQNERLLELHSALSQKAKELEIQKQKAEELTQLKSQFLATMSHELRTPMNAILGLTELVLEDQSVSSKNNERLSVVLRSGKRLLNLINDILDLSKIESGKMEIKFENFILDDLLDELKASFTSLAKEKDIELRVVNLAEEKLYLTTDRTKLLQILINLVGNSIKFTSEGYVEIRVSLLKNSVLKVEVEDNGIGISSEQQKIIFEEFRQADASTTRKFGGTGLGLSICKKFAEMLKGNITVKSELNKGSVFTVVVPVEVVHLFQQHKAAEEESPTFDKAAHSPVLIIEHQRGTRQMIANYVNSKGYETVFAESPDQCIQLVQRTLPLLVLVDTSFPALNFWKMVYDLKSDSETQKIPLVFYSANEEKKNGYALSPIQILKQPLTQEEFDKTIKYVRDLLRNKEATMALLDYEKSGDFFKAGGVNVQRYDELDNFKFEEDVIFINPFYKEGNALKKCPDMYLSSKGYQKLLFILLPENISPEESANGQNILASLSDISKASTYEILKVIRNAFYFLELGKQNLESLVEEEKIEVEREIKISDEKLYGENNAGNVLIVDDDSDSLFTINEIVQKCNCVTALAKNGKECLEILEKQKPDVILLDIMMPVMDGFQTLRAIREKPEFKDIPVIAVTAKAMIEDREIILKQGFDSYITKPINSGVLAFRLTRALSEKRAAQHEKDLSNR
ncbi:MAG: response regulator [Ignavibacteriaceae bacterium]|jgi:signal transduction histidine kinase/DNA-binding response OmpR family regulator